MFFLTLCILSLVMKIKSQTYTQTQREKERNLLRLINAIEMKTMIFISQKNDEEI